MANTNSKWLNKNDYSFPSKYFKTAQGNMHYVDVGEGDPIVMIHGNPAWSYEYRNVIKGLSDKHRCIANDHIGFGFSDKPSNWDYLPEHHAQNLEALLNHLELKNITLVVNDWGGPIGLSYALKYPEKIKKLVILNTWMWSVENDPHYQKFSGFMGGNVGSFLTKYFNFFGKSVVKMVFGDKNKLKNGVHEHYYKHLEKPSERKGCYTFPREIIGSSKWLASLWEQREKINKIPTTFIWGMKDIAFRENELNTFVNHWHNPKIIPLPDAGHYPQEESPETLVMELM